MSVNEVASADAEVQRFSRPVSHMLLLSVFFVSGAAALTYQVCWQRLLFAAFGVDIESITIIVSTFMLGLGVGSLLGGALADRFPLRLLELFVASELGIALFGMASPNLLPAAGDFFVQSGPVVIALVNFMIVLLPASFMGATLPMLVAYLFRENRNVGVSIGSLYFSNTMGASVGALLTGAILFIFFTLDEVIYFAACANALVAAITFVGVRAQ